MHPVQRVTGYLLIEYPSLDHLHQRAFEGFRIVDGIRRDTIGFVASAGMARRIEAKESTSNGWQ